MTFDVYLGYEFYKLLTISTFFLPCILLNVVVLHIHGNDEKYSHFGQNDEGLDEQKGELTIKNDDKIVAQHPPNTKDVAHPS